MPAQNDRLKQVLEAACGGHQNCYIDVYEADDVIVIDGAVTRAQLVAMGRAVETQQRQQVLDAAERECTEDDTLGFIVRTGFLFLAFIGLIAFCLWTWTKHP